ncbi:MAG: hypothetical protein MMC33_001019 [Icmadophila ericetorum]|nr:hypothetical protein [Icmadophila ericetorum]
MSAEAEALPIIDISPFLDPKATPGARFYCAQSLSKACLNHGFFYLKNHSVPPALTSEVLSLARAFFNECSPEEKVKIKRQDAGNQLGDGARGYQVIGDNVTKGKRDWHEAIDWYRPIIPGEGSFSSASTHHAEASNGLPKSRIPHNPPYTLLNGMNFWPSHPREFRKVYEEYIEHMLALGTAVVRAMGHALGLQDPEAFVKATQESFWVMRAIGYPPLPKKNGGRLNGDLHAEENEKEEEEEGVSCGAHTDYGCLTLLLADSTPGALQVQSRLHPNIWIPADPIEGAFVVNIGDMMERWTGGLWKSTLHRVVHRGDGFRVSVPFFFEPDFDARVGRLEGLGRAEEGREVVYGEYLIGKVNGNFYGNGSGEKEDGES